MKKWPLCILLLISFIGVCKGHQDFSVTHLVNETTLRIQTGFDFEEINKTSIICDLIDDLRDSYNYCKPIHIDFFHSYTNVDQRVIFLNVGRPKIIEKSYDSGVSKAGFDKEIIIRIIDNEFPVLGIMKLIEYAIMNEETIKKDQIQYSYKFLGKDWIIYSISQDKIQEIENKNISERINIINSIPHYLAHSPDFYGYSYYLKNGLYHIYCKNMNEIKEVDITLESVFQVENIGYGNAIIFDKKTSFQYCARDGQKQFNKHSIYLGEGTFRPFECVDLGGGKILIRYGLFTENQRDYYPGREILYIIDQDKTIDDFNTFIKEK